MALMSLWLVRTQNFYLLSYLYQVLQCMCVNVGDVRYIFSSSRVPPTSLIVLSCNPPSHFHQHVALAEGN